MNLGNNLSSGNVLHQISCNLCGSQKFQILSFSKKYPDRRVGDVVRCSGCGLVYRNFYPKYDSSPSQHHETHHRIDYPAKCTEGRLGMFNDYLGKVSSYRKYNRILDVGPGQGFFLKLCSDKGWEVFGVEINTELVEFTTNKLGIKIFNGSLEQAQYEENYFDVVTFWNVLDHLIKPDGALEEAYRILRPGGAVFLRVPNAVFHIACQWLFHKLCKLWNGVRRFDHSVIHLYSFNRVTISRYLRKAGFQFSVLENGEPTWLHEGSRKFDMRKMIGASVRGWAEIVKIMSSGHLLIGPSLLVRAIKPIQ